MTYHMYFIHTLIIRCTVSEILAEIDHKGPNWTILTSKMITRVIPYLSYFMKGIGFTTKKLHDEINLDNTSLLLININNMGKWAKPDLSYLENDLLNKSMKSIS